MVMLAMTKKNEIYNIETIKTLLGSNRLQVIC